MGILWYQRMAWSHSGQRDRGKTKPSPVPRRSHTTVRKLPTQPPRQPNQTSASHHMALVSKRSCNWSETAGGTQVGMNRSLRYSADGGNGGGVGGRTNPFLGLSTSL